MGQECRCKPLIRFTVSMDNVVFDLRSKNENKFDSSSRGRVPLSLIVLRVFRIIFSKTLEVHDPFPPFTIQIKMTKFWNWNRHLDLN